MVFLKSITQIPQKASCRLQFPQKKTRWNVWTKSLTYEDLFENEIERSLICAALFSTGLLSFHANLQPLKKSLSHYSHPKIQMRKSLRTASKGTNTKHQRWQNTLSDHSETNPEINTCCFFASFCLVALSSDEGGISKSPLLWNWSLCPSLD